MPIARNQSESEVPIVLIVHPRLIPPGPHYQILQQAGFEIRLAQEGLDAMQPEVLKELLRGAEAAIAGLEPFNREVIEASPDLRVVARCGVGYDTVDVDACRDHDVLVTITPGTNQHSVAEHALAMMLALSRGFPQRDLIVRGKRPWSKTPLPRFAGSTVGIVGLGRIGRALAERLPGLQVKTLAYEPYPDDEFVSRHGVRLTDLATLLRESDFISLHLPVTPESQGMINRDSIATMKRGAVLINTARGGLVVEGDLHAALTSGQLAGAGLDVLNDEPPADDHPLLALENVLFSPHAAGIDEQAHVDSITLCGQVVADLYQGKRPLECIVNREGIEQWQWRKDP